MLTRRNFLSASAFGLSSLSLLPSGLARARANKKLILLWMEGGPSQIDTFDPKPGTAVGGPFQAIESAVSGIRISEHLPLIAKEMKSVALLRSLTAQEGNHGRARHLLRTGYLPAGATDHPCLCSVAASELGDKNGALPSYVRIGKGADGAGFLGPSAAPYVVPEKDAGNMPPNLALPEGLSRTRFDRRLELLGLIEKNGKSNASIGESVASARARALRMMGSTEIGAFDVSNEPAAVRQAYGDSDFGRGLLVARRLVERGVEAIEVRLDGWDTHENNFERVRALSADLDRGMGTLLRELRERGLLDETLVVWLGEFGRTPSINGKSGRDHHPRAFSAALAGAGVRGGQVVGATSKDGVEVSSRPVSVPDLLLTIYTALGVDPKRTFYTEQGRPIGVVAEGAQAIKELI